MSWSPRRNEVGAGAVARNPRTSRTLFVLVAAFFVLMLLLTRRPKMHESIRDPPDIALPANLEEVVVAQFDKLVSRGEIFYEDTQPELVDHNGFQFEFRMVSFLDKKPISAPNSPDRTKAGGPFEDPPRNEIVTGVGPSHRLLLNKFCIYRPMLVLPTVTYAPQTDDLDESDIAAAWSVLRTFKTPQMVIYNCGANAGSSIGHKHLQIFPQPTTEGRVLFPAHAPSIDFVGKKIDKVPFKHFVLRIPRKASVAMVYKQYLALLNETRMALLVANAGSDYNVIFTADWIALIPRRTAVWGGPYGANAAGMVGMVTVPNQQQRNQWAELGYTEYLTRLGIPID